MELGPDGRRERLFRPLDEVDPAIAASLRNRFVEQWLDIAAFPATRHEDALQTVDLRVGPGEGRGEQRLRLTSSFTGSTRWLDEWDGTEEGAASFVDDAAEMEGGWVHDERRLNGPTEWD